MIPLGWLKADIDSARIVLNREGGQLRSPSGWYVGNTPITADFELSYESFAPFLVDVLDAMAPIEAAGLCPALVEIRNGKIRVF